MQSQHSGMVVKRKYKRYSKQKMTYLGLIAYVIQNAPEKRLTFCELMNEIGTFVVGDRKGLENNIRVCLSLNDCFVKVPINPECPNARRNFWKLDDSKITPKMMRRHFNGIRDMFPDIYGNSETTSTKNATAKKVNNSSNGTETEQKFTSSFSIESILQRENSAPTSPAYFPRTFTNACPGLTPSADYRLACKRKTWDYQDQMQYDNFISSYSHFSFPSYCLGQTSEGCSPMNPPSRMSTAPELSYNYTVFDNTRQFTSYSVAWAYI